MPRYSIIIPARNAALTLGAALDSLLAQCVTDWEALIIEDGSDDATRAIAEGYADADMRFRVLSNVGHGLSQACNLGAAIARGEILAFCRPDRLWMPGRLRRMDEAFADATLDACYGRIALMDNLGSYTLSTVPEGDLTVEALLADNPAGTLSNMAVRRDVFQATGGLDTRISTGASLEWALRLVGEGFRLRGIDATLTIQRATGTAMADLPALCAGRLAALVTASRYAGAHTPERDAQRLRAMTRRALRRGAPRRQSLQLALLGLRTSPAGWFSDMRRGTLTLSGALVAPILPATLRRTLFAN